MIQIKRVGQMSLPKVAAKAAVTNKAVEPVGKVKVTLRNHRRSAEWIAEIRSRVIAEAKKETLFRQLCG